MTTNDKRYVPEIQVEFKKLDSEHVGSTSSGTDSDDDKKTRNIKLLPRSQQLLRLDSGSSIGEDDEPAELTDELREKIILQAEYYFSDENLRKDGFLLKHVKRNKEGFVNLKLLASFKKMRSLSRDYRVIGEALKESTKLVVNETGLKLRRVTPLPKELLDQIRVKHIVLTNIPHENPSMNFITEAFEKHKDEVVSVRVVKPGKKFPNDLQSHFSRHPELREQIVAVVEFETPDVANEAIKTVFGNQYKGLAAKLLELGPKQAKKIGNNASGNSDNGNDSDGNISRQGSKKGKRTSRLLEVSGAEDNNSNYGSSASDSEFSAFSSCNRRYNRSRGNSPSTSPKTNRRFDTNNNSKNNSRNNSRNASPATSPMTSPKNARKSKTPERSGSQKSHKLSPLINGVNTHSPSSSPEMERKNSSSENKENGGTRLSPWMQRRMMMAENKANELKSAMNAGLPQLEIIRQPKGPDGSTGFSNHPLKKYILVHAY